MRKMLAILTAACLASPTGVAWAETSVEDVVLDEATQESAESAETADLDLAEGQSSEEVVSASGEGTPGVRADASAEGAESEASPASVAGTEMEFTGLCNIASHVSDGMVLDIVGGQSASGAACQTWYGNTTIAQRFRIDSTGDGYYTITNVNSGKVLDVVGASAQPGTPVQQYEANGTDAQKWEFVELADGTCAIVSKLGDDLVLDVEGGSSSAGARVQIYTYNGTNAQKFSVDAIERTVENGVYFVKSSNSGKYLDVVGGSDSNGANVQQYEGNGTLAQKFLLEYDEGTGYYTLTNGQSGKVLEVQGAADWDGANVAQYDSNGTAAQRWTIEDLGSGQYALRSAVGGKVLDVAGVSSENGANVQVWSWSDTPNQKWSFEQSSFVGGGLYSVEGESGLVLDIEGNGTSNGTPVKVYSPNGTQAQKFLFRTVGSDRYAIEAVNSGKVLEVSGGAGPSVVLASNTGSSSQIWKIRPAGSGQMMLVNEATGTVLGQDPSGSGYVRVSAWTGSAKQKWSIVETAPIADGCYELLSSTDRSFVLEIEGAADWDGAKVQIYRRNGTNAQKFWVERQADGNYILTNISSGKSLDVKDWAIDQQTGAGVVQQWESNGSTAQQWRIEYVADGAFALYSVLGDGQSCLDVTGNTMVNGISVGVYRGNGTSAQRWVFQPTDGEKPQEPEEPEGPGDSEGGSDPGDGGNVEVPETGEVTYKNYNMTLDQMTTLQMDNPYVTASKEEVKNALDPDNSAVGSKYQFADLRGYSGATAEPLDAYIDSTNLGKSGMLHGMGWAFVEAAKTYNVNEVYLLAHAIIESGWGTSTLAMGYYYDGTQDIEGKYYPKGTYYNFYGIGAYDSSPLSGGRSLAIQNGWDSPEKAILGAAQWITTNYTYGGIYPQPTLYDMKWDPQRTNDTLSRGWHQYATDIYWARSIARVMDEIYATTDLGSSVDFIIPRYAG